MVPHVNFTPKISKRDVHLGYMQVPLSSNVPIICTVFVMKYLSRFDDFVDPKL